MLRAFPQYRILLKAAPQEIHAFLPWFQEGVGLHLEQELSLRHLLVRRLGLEPRVVSRRVGTILLDGKPVDSDEVLLTPGSTLALSGPMPGLVGATLRRGSPLGFFRSSITHHQGERGGVGGNVLRIKLFNLLIQELAPALLRHGVLIQVPALIRWLEGQDSWLMPWKETLLLDGIPLTEERAQILRESPPEAWVEVRLLSADHPGNEAPERNS